MMNKNLEMKLSAGLNPPPPLVLIPENVALLVVDMQYFDAHPEWGEGRTASEIGVLHTMDDYFAQIDQVIPKIQDLLTLFRRKEMEVIHLRVAEWTKDSRDVGWKQLVRGLICPSNSREADPLKEVAPVDDEIVISKSSSGVFPVTNIDRLLRNIGIKTLIFTGTSTGGCVESAVRDAVDLGYDVVVVSDACAAGTLNEHQTDLWRMEGGLTRVMSTAEVTALISCLPNCDPKKKSGLERVKPYLPKPPVTPPAPDVDPYSLIFPPALQHPLSRAKTALAVVDATHLTCDPACGLGKKFSAQGRLDQLSPYYQRVDQALAGIRRLLEVCRQVGLTVIHLKVSGQLPGGRDLGRKLRSQGLAFSPSDPEASFMEGMGPSSGEIVLNKPSSGIFTGTGLDELLRNLGIEHVILTGISYDGAIEGSIRSLGDRGYGVVLVPDAIATYQSLLQEKLWGMEVGVIQVYSVVQLTSRLLALKA
jgi:nicotinamidase-related amidase